MKLRNKKTGEILETARSSAVMKDKIKIYDEISDKYYTYGSLAELNEEWEDYEGRYYKFTPALLDNRIVALIVDEKATRKEAREMMEKLKAFKRLKDKGFVFKGINMNDGSIKTGLSKGVPLDDCEGFYSDMKLLFGGEE